MRAVAETAIDVVALALVVVGVFLLWGFGWAFIAAGALALAVSIYRALVGGSR